MTDRTNWTDGKGREGTGTGGNGRRRLLYLCGPMTGYANANREAFADAKMVLEAAGYAVLSPAVWPDGLSGREYMRLDLPMLLAADGVALLRGWEGARGCRAELKVADYCGMEVGRVAYWVDMVDGECKVDGVDSVDGVDLVDGVEARERTGSAGEQRAPYGFCPQCGAPGVLRERCPFGCDVCGNGHRYKSLEAVDGDGEKLVPRASVRLDEISERFAREVTGEALAERVKREGRVLDGKSQDGNGREGTGTDGDTSGQAAGLAERRAGGDAGRLLAELTDGVGLGGRVRTEVHNRGDDEGRFEEWTEADWKKAAAWEREILSGLVAVVEGLVEEFGGAQQSGCGAHGALRMEWDVGERTLRLKFVGASGLTVRLDSPDLARTVGRWLLREVGLDEGRDARTGTDGNGRERTGTDGQESGMAKGGA